jgi:hypothetical protein
VWSLMVWYSGLPLSEFVWLTLVCHASGSGRVWLTAAAAVCYGFVVVCPALLGSGLIGKSAGVC